MATIAERLKAYIEILDKKEKLEAETKENNALKEQMEQEICQMMINEEKPSEIVDGFNFSLKVETKYSKLSDEKLAAKGLDFFDVLREQGLGDIIVERVDPRTLSSTCKGIAEENDGELPEELAEVLSEYEKMSLSKRKANMNAINKAKKN